MLQVEVSQLRESSSYNSRSGIRHSSAFKCFSQIDSLHSSVFPAASSEAEKTFLPLHALNEQMRRIWQGQTVVLGIFKITWSCQDFLEQYEDKQRKTRINQHVAGMWRTPLTCFLSALIVTLQFVSICEVKSKSLFLRIPNLLVFKATHYLMDPKFRTNEVGWLCHLHVRERVGEKGRRTVVKRSSTNWSSSSILLLDSVIASLRIKDRR